MPEPIETEIVEENLETEEIQEEEVESRETVIDKIKSKISDFVGLGSSEAGEEISDEFSSAATELGWTDDDIVDFAGKYTNEELIEMIPDLAVEASESSEELAETHKEEVEEKVEDSQDDEKIQKLLDRIDALEKAQGAVEKDSQEKKQEGFAQKASKFFDDAAKEFEVFGSTDDLPKFPDGRLVPNSPQMKARNEVWGVAVALQQTGMDFDKAFDTSMHAYKGRNLANQVKRSVIKGLKKNESRLSGKHTSHESHETRSYGPDVIRDVARRAGREIN